MNLLVGGRTARTDSGSGLRAPTFGSRFRWWKFEFVALHVHTAAAENYAFGFQAETLLHRRIASQLDLPSRAKNAVPGQAERAPQSRYHLPRSAGMARRAGNAAVGCNLAARNFPDRCKNVRLQRHADILSPAPYSAIQPARISQREPAEISNHNAIPCSKGRWPTFFSVAMDRPLPIK